MTVGEKNLKASVFTWKDRGREEGEEKETETMRGDEELDREKKKREIGENDPMKCRMESKIKPRYGKKRKKKKTKK